MMKNLESRLKRIEKSIYELLNPKTNRIYSIVIDETIGEYNFIGNNWKACYAMNWLSKKAVSAENQKLGASAGYFFFETSEGFKFKSIDGLLSQEKKKSFIYNQTPDSRGDNIPAGKSPPFDLAGHGHCPGRDFRHGVGGIEGRQSFWQCDGIGFSRRLCNFFSEPALAQGNSPIYDCCPCRSDLRPVNPGGIVLS